MKKEQFTKLLKVAKSSTIPVIDKTGYVKDGRITATDLEITISMPCPYEGEGIIDVKMLSKIKGISKLVLNPETCTAIATVGHGTQKIALFGNTDEWPSCPEVGEKIAVITSHDIKNMKIANRFVGSDEMRPVMSGVCITDKRVCATDAQRLFRQDTASELPEETEIIIPKRVVELLNDGTPYILHQWKRDEKDIRVYYTLTDGEEIITFRPIEGQYPQIESAIPQENPLTLAVDTKTFRDALEAALPSANSSTKQITVFIRKDWMKIEACDLDFENEFTTIIPVSTTWSFPEPKPVEEGADIPPAPEVPEVFVIGFKGEFMLDILRLSGQTTTIKLSHPNRALLIGPCLLMPMMVTGDEKGFPVSQIPSETEQPVVRVQAVAEGFKPLAFRGIVLADYSERAFVIRGKTKDHKDKLKELNGRFNPYLEGGPGWVFPKVWYEKVVASLKN